MVQNFELVGQAPEDYPLQKKRHGFDFLREIAHLRPRTNTFTALFRLRSGDGDGDSSIFSRS